MNNKINILNDDNNDIEVIYHLSDIHIKQIISQELNEHYIDMIEKICNNIKKQTENALIYIGGDIIDTGYSTECIKMIKYFFYKLSQLCPVLYIFGNHDLSNKRNIEISDMISPIISDYFDSKYKIFPLLKEGSYRYNNVVFNLISLNATIMPKFNIDKKYISIGCYHGQVAHKNLDNIIKKQCVFDVNEFEFNFKYTMLGDCHNHMFIDDNNKIAYSGSIYEINYRECNIKKGFIKWDLKKEKGEFIKIDGIIKHMIFKVVNGKLQDYDKKKMPEKAKVKIIYENTLMDQLDEIEKKIKTENNVIEFLVERDMNDMYIDTDVMIGGKKKKIEDIKNFDVVKKMIVDNIKNKNECNKKCIVNINNYLNNIVNKIDYKFNENVNTFKIKRVEFDNINIYKKNNVIDFDLFNKKICEISGSNGIGKSTIITVILLGLWNEVDIGTKFDCINIVNIDDKAKIIIDLEINGEKYQVKRIMKVRSLKKRETEEDLYLYKNGKDITGTTNIDTQKKINKLLGTYDNIIDTNVILQRNYKSFIDLTNIEKKNVISKISKIDVFDEIAKYVRSDINKLHQEIPKINKRIAGLLGDSDKKKGFVNIEMEFVEENTNNKDKLDKLSLKKENAEKEYNELKKQKIELEFMLKDYDKLKNKKIKEIKLVNNKKIEENEDELKKVQDLLDDTNVKLDKVNKQLNNKKYKDYDRKKKEFDEENKNILDDLIEEKNKLLLKMIPVNKEQKNKDNRNIERDIKNLNLDISKLKKQIELARENIFDIDDSIVEKYKEFKILNSNNDDIQKNILRINKDIEKYKENQKNIGEIEYDSDCEFCIKLKNKLNFEEHIQLLNIELKKYNKEKKDNDKKLKDYEDCEIKYKEYQENKVKNDDNIKIQEIKQNDIVKHEKDLQRLNKELKKINDNYDKAVNSNDNTEKELDIINDKINKQKCAKLEGFEEYNKIVDEKYSLEKLCLEFGNNINNINKILHDMKKNRDEYDKNVKEREELLNKINQMEKDNNTLVGVNKKYDKIEKELNNINNEIDEIKKKIMKNDIIIKQVDELKIEVKKISDDRTVANMILKSLDKDGVQDTIMTNNIIPKIELEVNTLLSFLTDFKIEIKYLNKVLQVYKIINKNYKVLKVSGYEHMIIGLVFRLVFCNLRNNTKMLFLDEIFACADKKGTERLGRLFEYIRSYYEFALIITHDDSIKKFCDVSFNIENNNGFSKINISNDGKKKIKVREKKLIK